MAATHNTAADGSTDNNQNDDEDDITRVKDVMPEFTDWRNHPNNPDRDDY